MIERLELLILLPGLIAATAAAVLAGWVVYRWWPHITNECVVCDICRGDVPARQSRDHRLACADLTAHDLFQVDRALLLLGLDIGDELHGARPLGKHRAAELAEQVGRHYAQAERISS